MRILALTWPTRGGNDELMINTRRDLICPAIDGLAKALLARGHQVVYVNLAEEVIDYEARDLALPTFVSGLKMHKLSDLTRWDFDLCWHAIMDPTPTRALDLVSEAMTRLPDDIPVMNDARRLCNHRKDTYLPVLATKNIGAELVTSDGVRWKRAEDGSQVSEDGRLVNLRNKNSDGGDGPDRVAVRYIDNAGVFRPGLRSFFRVPFALGACLPGTRYFFDGGRTCPKSGVAVDSEPYEAPRSDTIIGAMHELGIDIAHIEGLETGKLDSNTPIIKIFDVNPFPTSSGRSMTPMSARIAERIEQVYDI